MTRAERIKYYVDRMQNDEISISGIRKEMEAQSFNDKEIRACIRQIDNQILRENERVSNRSLGFNFMIGGSILFVIGLVITVGTLLNLIPSMKSVEVIFYGPIAVGFGLMAKGYHQWFSNK